VTSRRGGWTGGRTGGFAVVLRVCAALVVGSLGMTSVPAETTLTYELCQRNTKITIAGAKPQQVVYPSPGPLTTFDAQLATFTAYPFASLYPFSVGKETAPTGLCVIGGLVRGSQSRSLTWDQMKDLYDGDGLRVSGNHHYVVDGIRIDNVEDGIAPRGTEDRFPKDGDGFVIRNAYTTYIRDDCVENDDIGGGLIIDSLFDGCYTGVSERPGDGNPQNNWPAPPGETLRLHEVLLRLQAMPGPRDTNDPAVKGHGQLFKWSDVANQLVVTDSIFLVEKVPNSDSSFPFPPRTITNNVTIVWLGGPLSSFTWDVPFGTTVTTNKSVWDTARAKWLNRHGCTSFDLCTKLHQPTLDLGL
jgi:hypothetical protein